MKTPFRLQASEYDCVPTTFINAISYLFERHEIPPIVLQRIYLCCLDSISLRRHFGHGTTDTAIELLGNWLTEYKHNRFKVSCESLRNNAMHLATGSPISRCLNEGGVALISVTRPGGHWHHILGLYVEERWLYAFDPYPKTSKASRRGKYEFFSPESLHAPNVRIHYDWIDTNSEKWPFRFGTRANRACLLMRRVA